MGQDYERGLFHDVMDVGRWNLESQKYVSGSLLGGSVYCPILLLFYCFEFEFGRLCLDMYR